MPNRIGLHCLYHNILIIEYGLYMLRGPLLEVGSTRIHAQSINLRRIDVEGFTDGFRKPQLPFPEREPSDYIASRSY